MTIELKMLAWAVVLGLVHALSTGLQTIAEHGTTYSVGPQDEQKPVSRIKSRNRRAFANFMQTFPFFAAAVLAAHVADRHGAMTVWGAQLYFWGRLIYVPIYLAGTPWVRTAVFGVATAGIVLLLLALT
jgi:uncharacterized MAPEG superfamily protein